MIPYSTLKYLHEEIKNELNDAFNKVLDSGWFINGKECESFEREFAKYCQTKYAIGCGNGLDALSIALKSLGIKKGDEVIVPGFTFIATALSVVNVGATPVFVDVDADTSLINVNQIEDCITSHTKAIIPVHLYGQPVDIFSVQKIAYEHNLKIIYDAAQAHGAKYNGKSISTYGTATCYSFYPGKNLGALGDGGAITTDDPAYSIMKKLTNYGSEKKYHHEYMGVNSRLDELQAAFLRVKLSHLDKKITERKTISQRYLKEINNDSISLPIIKNGDHVWHIFPIHSEKRDKIVKYLYEKGIETNIHYPIPIHLQKAFEDYPYKKGDLPITEQLSETEISLPLYNGMTTNDVDYIIDTINKMRV